MNKGQIRRTEAIAASATTVFRFLTDLERMPEWDPGVSHARSMTRGPLRRGSVIRQTVERDGEAFHMDDEITEFDPPWRFAIRSVHEALNIITYSLSEASEGITRLDVVLGFELPDAPTDSPISDALVRQGVNDALGHAMRRLKESIERESA